MSPWNTLVFKAMCVLPDVRSVSDQYQCPPYTTSVPCDSPKEGMT